MARRRSLGSKTGTWGNGRVIIPPGALLALTLVGCVASKSPLVVVLGSDADGVENLNSQRIISPAAGMLSGDQGPKLVSANLPGLVGRLSVPQTTLIGNNSVGLIETGGGAFLRLPYTLQALTQNAHPNADVRLVSLDGKDLGLGVVQTDQFGRYEFRAVPQDGNFLVQAKFSGEGKDFSFLAPVFLSASGSATADIDAASTLVASKIQATSFEGGLNFGNLSPAAYLGLRSKLTESLSGGNIPYMAANSRDIVAAFDQLVADLLEIRNAATGLDRAISEPKEAWGVETVFDSNMAIAAGILANGQSLSGDSGHFEVDAEGNLYMAVGVGTPSASEPKKINDGASPDVSAGAGSRLGAIPEGPPLSPPPVASSNVHPAGRKIMRIAKPPSTRAEVYATLPDPTTGPVALSFSPDGTLYAFCLNTVSRNYEVYFGSGQMKKRQGALFPETAVRLGDNQGRLVVDANNAIYFTLRDYHVVGKMSQIKDAAEVFAGNRLDIASPVAGYLDGSAANAQFSFPASVTLSAEGSLLVADFGNNCIRRVGLDGAVTTIAGKRGDTTYRNGRGAFARFGTPESVVADTTGELGTFIMDSMSKRIRRLSESGSVFLIAGSGEDGVADGPGTQASFHAPRLLTMNRQKNLYLLDRQPEEPGKPVREIIRKISRR